VWPAVEAFFSIVVSLTCTVYLLWPQFLKSCGLFCKFGGMNEQQVNELLKRVTIKSGLMGGKPTIRGLRFPVGDILEMLASGMKQEAILEQHPILQK
jgi:uncharacterized protein (DUF433 family)